jgi:tRNA-Thr(GGU) m(6)t(6)A37 methyltransferase TsaA
LYDSTLDSSFALRIVGRVESPLLDRKDAPRQPDEGAPPAVLVFEPEMREALEGIRPGDEIVVVTWLHLGRRDTMRVRPRRDPARREVGVFATRSPDRPNPIGLHDVVVTWVEDLRIGVRGMEAVDGTPILDVKARLDPDVAKR